MAENERPSPEAMILYAKDPKTKIATITFNRPEFLNAPTAAPRLRYADLLHAAGVDDDVKVVVIRGVGDDFGSGAGRENGCRAVTIKPSDILRYHRADQSRRRWNTGRRRLVPPLRNGRLQVRARLASGSGLLVGPAVGGLIVERVVNTLEPAAD
jgi:hypothetical protein